MAVDARLVTDEMISAAAHALGAFLTPEAKGAAVIPPVARLTEFSAAVAVAVAECAVRQGLNRRPVTDVKAAVEAMVWKAAY